MTTNKVEDYRQILDEMIRHPGMVCIIHEMNQLLSTIEQNVLKLYLDRSNERDLLILKARAEGARSIVDGFSRRINSLKSAKDEGKVIALGPKTRK